MDQKITITGCIPMERRQESPDVHRLIQDCTKLPYIYAQI